MGVGAPPKPAAGSRELASGLSSPTAAAHGRVAAVETNPRYILLGALRGCHDLHSSTHSNQERTQVGEYAAEVGQGPRLGVPTCRTASAN